jgi:molybdopterin-binding protein
MVPPRKPDRRSSAHLGHTLSVMGRVICYDRCDPRCTVSAPRHPERGSGLVGLQASSRRRGAVARPIVLKDTMRISARNQIKGKILDVKKGATTSHVRLEIAPGQVIMASITNEAVDELGLKAGAVAMAVIKASDVMIAVE